MERERDRAFAELKQAFLEPLGGRMEPGVAPESLAGAYKAARECLLSRVEAGGDPELYLWAYEELVTTMAVVAGQRFYDKLCTTYLPTE